MATVQVFLVDSTQPLRSLDNFGFMGMESPYRGADWFRAVDINFDGYKDIYMMTSWGVTGNEIGCVWLYDPPARRFEFSKDFSAIGKFILDPATNTITTGGVGGHAGRIFRMIKYTVEDNRPVPIFDVLQTWDTERNKYHCVVKQRQSDDN